MQKDNTAARIGATMELNTEMKEKAVALVFKELRAVTLGMDPIEKALFEVQAFHSIYEHAHGVGYRKGRLDGVLNIESKKEV